MLINYLYLRALKSIRCAIQRQHTRKTNLISAIDDQTFYTYFSSIPEFFPFHSKSSFICVTLCLRLESNKSPNKIKREQGKNVSRPILASFLKQTTYKQQQQHGLLSSYLLFIDITSKQGMVYSQPKS